ncbi:MAG TPA: hypothetical protein VGN14_11590 [Candidatus Elarobacter sp.]
MLPFAGALAADRYPEFRTAFERTELDRPVIVDLREVSSVDPTFLAELLLFRRRRRPWRVAVLLRPGGDLERIFGLAPMKGKVRVFEDEARGRAELDREPFDENAEDDEGELAAEY